MTDLSSRVLALIALLALGVGGVQASEALTVATKHAPPFVSVAEDGSVSGISIDIWERVAAAHDWTTEWQVGELDEILAAAAGGEVSAAISAITTTAERERTMDFSHPYFTTGLGIAVVPGEGRGWVSVIANFFTLEFASAILALCLVLGVASVLVYLAERHHNEQFAGHGAVSGIGNSFWWSAVTMTTVGYGDLAPKTRAGRMVALCWMFASVIIISSFTASIASSLTVGSLGPQISGPDDLHRARVAVVANTFAAGWADDELSGVRRSPDLTTALADLSAGRVDAVVHDRPLLRYAVGLGDEALEVLPVTFQRQDYAIALPENSEHREAINRTLHTLIADGIVDAIIDKHL